MSYFIMLANNKIITSYIDVAAIQFTEIISNTTLKNQFGVNKTLIL